MRLSLVFFLAVILLTGCTSQQAVIADYEREQMRLEAENEQLRSELANVQGGVAALRRDLQRAEADVRLLQQPAPGSGLEEQGETVEVLQTDVYFESGSALLTSQGQDRLNDVATRLKQVYPRRVIRVEGHTDSKPVGPSLQRTYPSNWELSAARAAAVVRHLEQRHAVRSERFELVGYGPFRPIGSNDTAEGRTANRRVRIAVLATTIE
ncbi:MAG: OmpA family protein [Rhodothermales bacterium]